MEDTDGTTKAGSGKIHQMTVIENLVLEAQLITNDLKILSDFKSDSDSALQALIVSDNKKASELLDNLTKSELMNIRRAAVDLAMMCNRKILE